MIDAELRYRIERLLRSDKRTDDLDRLHLSLCNRADRSRLFGASRRFATLLSRASLINSGKGVLMSETGSQLWAEKANETAVKMAHEILRTLIIVHGGATIAMLSFIGTVLGNGRLTDNGAALLSAPLMAFGWGIVITIGAMVAAYFTDGLVVAHTFQQQTVGAAPADEIASARLRRLTFGKTCVHIIAVCLTAASIGAFVSGMYALKAGMGSAFRSPNAYQTEQVSPVKAKDPAHSQPLAH